MKDVDSDEYRKRSNVIISNKQSDLSISKISVRNLVQGLLVFLKIDTDQVYINFVSEKAIKDLHLEFFNDEEITDCISMPIDGLNKSAIRPRVLGEIFVCPRKAILYSLEKNLDPYEETSLYVVHGILHLLGYDDIELKDRRKMRELERKSTDFLKSQNLLLKSSS